MITLRKEKQDHISRNKHPWIFSGAIDKIQSGVTNGSLVSIHDNNNDIIGWGLYSSQSQIAVRMLNYNPEKPNKNWLEERLTNAWQFRKSLNIKSNAFRLVNAEGDFIPGLIIDVYNKTVVTRPLTKYIELQMDTVVDGLKKLMPESAIYIKRDEYNIRKEGMSIENGFLYKPQGRKESDAQEIIEENGIQFKVDFKEGQKTGFYLDQRANRNWLKSFSQGKKLVNLFSYTGGFSYYAAAGGAAEIVSVDTSKNAIAIAQENLTLNPELKSSQFSWHIGDVFKYLEQDVDADIFILDPPPFARKKSEVPGAVKGYQFINHKAIEKVKAEGFIFTFSCSGSISKSDFVNILYKSAYKSGRDVRMIKELHAPADHPFSIYHPEGEYLKGWILYVN